MTPDDIVFLMAGLDLVLGLVLVYFPRSIVRLTGLPYTAPRLYARVLGGVTFGIGMSLVIEAVTHEGLGLLGAAAIHLSGAAVLLGCLVFLRLRLPVKGYISLGFGVAVFTVLSLMALATA